MSAALDYLRAYFLIRRREREMKKGSSRPKKDDFGTNDNMSMGEMEELLDEQRKTIQALSVAVEALANALAVVNDESDSDGEEDDDAEGDEDKESES